jgi:L-asparaginase II
MHIHVLRGGLLESRHRVHAAVVSPDGHLFASVGDPNHSSFLRSSAKAFQAQPLIPHLETLGLSDKHLAIAMASHAGDATHVETVLEMLQLVGIESSLLCCGIHAPFDAATRKEMRVIGLKPSVLQNNCSGKHAAMLAACLAKGLPLEGYELPQHPLQQEILRLLEVAFATHAIGVGTDGCSVPCFRVPLHNAALGMARLAEPASLPEHSSGFEQAYRAMRAHPHLIAGTGRLDTLLIQSQANLVSKIGAEAYMLLAVRDPAHGNLGIALKIEDGNERVLGVAVVALLEQLGLLSDPSALKDLQAPIIKNHAGLEVGQYTAAFEVQFC